MEVLRLISVIIALAAITIIVWGALMAVIELVMLEVKRFKGENICKRREYARHHFGSYLLMGLELLIAADIIHTVINPTFQDLVVLGSIVAIRTVINFFLNKEMEGRHDCRQTN